MSDMRVIIAGCRDIYDYDLLLEAIRTSNFNITTVISGGASGVDALGERYAQEMDIPLKVYKADWERYGKAAGPMRNKKMAEAADAVIAIWDGESRGTFNMMQTATKMGLAVHLCRWNQKGKRSC